MSNTDIIIHDEKDNVGVVVIEKITPDQDCNCWIMENDKSVSIQSKDEIPLGLKVFRLLIVLKQIYHFPLSNNYNPDLGLFFL